MPDLLAQWFASDGFMPHGHCYLWTPALLWSYIGSDGIIVISYYSIALGLMYLSRQRPDPRYSWMFTLFAVFIFACGTSHLVALWTIWHPDYWLDAAVKAITALASAATALLLWREMPTIMKLPTLAQLREVVGRLEHEISERKKVEQALLHSQETLRELAAYQERIREDERKRIAREIHDELGQNLLALRLDVSRLDARAGEQYPQLKKRTEAALDYIDTTMKSIRTIMNNLRPAVLDLGLQAAIEWQVEQFERRTGVACEVLMSDEGLQVDDEHATAIFRILQESLTNVGRHARATEVRIELHADGQRIRMSIADNGVGMFPGDRRKARRFGLVGIQERAAMLGGELCIDSAPGKGTVLRLVIPKHSSLPQADEALA